MNYWNGIERRNGQGKGRRRFYIEKKFIVFPNGKNIWRLLENRFQELKKDLEIFWTSIY